MSMTHPPHDWDTMPPQAWDHYLDAVTYLPAALDREIILGLAELRVSNLYILGRDAALAHARLIQLRSRLAGPVGRS